MTWDEGTLGYLNLLEFTREDLRWQAAAVQSDVQFISLFPKYVFEVALIVSMMMTGGAAQAALPRDTVFATVMIICNGVVGVCLLLGAIVSTTDPAAHVAFVVDGSLPGLTVDRIDPAVETQRYIDKIMATRGRDLDAHRPLRDPGAPPRAERHDPASLRSPTSRSARETYFTEPVSPICCCRGVA